MSKSTFVKLYNESTLFALWKAAECQVSSAQIQLWVLQARADVARAVC